MGKKDSNLKSKSTSNQKPEAANVMFDNEDEEIEVLSLDEDKITRDNLANVNSSSEHRKVNTSRESSIKPLMFLVVITVLLAVFYTVFAQPLAFNGRLFINQSKKQDGIWDIKFTNMYKSNVIGTASEIQSPSYTSTLASFHVSLSNLGDEISYDITITNGGTLNAKVSEIVINPMNQSGDSILYSVNNIKIGDELDAGKSLTFRLTAKYNSNYSGSAEPILKNVTVLVNFVQK